MNFNGWVNFEDLLKSCGYTNSSDSENNSGCNDIPNGFQSLHPELFALIGELLGNIIAGSIPFNVQNVIGNWFELIGQAILVFNAQQQYFQSGPGRYFNPKNYNISNPFCNTNSSSTSPNPSNTSNASTSSNTSSSNSNDVNIGKLQDLEKQVQALTSEINKLKEFIQNS